MSNSGSKQSIKKLWLQNFRAHQELLADFSDGVTCIIGPNGSGKTTIIEAVALLGTGKSFRAHKLEEMIGFSAELARVKSLSIDAEAEEQHVQISLTRGVLHGAQVPKSQYELNGVKKQKRFVVGQFYPVVFRPEDMRLIEGSPGRRRGFVDTLIGSLNLEYGQALKQYENVLKRRNKLLQAIREGEQSKSSLQYWDEKLLEYGEALQAARSVFFEFANTVSFAREFSVQYLPKLLSKERLIEYESRSIAAGHTLIGPHKDDFEVFLPLGDEQQPRETSVYGSRGQQRLAVLWLKVCELLYAQQFEQPTVLLLDDIFSELDSEAHTIVADLCTNQQTIVTSAQDLDNKLVISHTVELA